MPETADLLEEIAALKAMLIAADARDKRKDERIARLEKLVAAFKQAVFGRKSEKSDPDQFELALEDLETAMAVVHAEEDAEDQAAKRPAKPRAANRGSLPKRLPRIEEIIEPDSLIEITRSGPAPIAEDGVALIRELYAIEAEIRGTAPATRLAIRQDRSAAILARLDDWLAYHRARASAKSPLGEALAYIAKYRDGLGRFLTDGRIEIDNNTVERTIRPIALNRKSALFAGHDAGAENWAVIASLIETCKMNAIDPHVWLANTLTAIVKGHKQSQIDDLLPWNSAVMV